MPTQNRRDESAAATRQLLLDAAARMFSQQGFAKTSLSDIAARAGATKGALYHHFLGKEALYASCYEQQAAKVAAIVRAAGTSGDPWQDTLEKCRAFLGCARLRHLNAVPIQEAIIVLGWQRWRELDSAHTMGELELALARLSDAGLLGSFDRRLLADSLFAVLVSAMMTLSESRDRAATEAELMRQLSAFLSGVMSASNRPIESEGA